MRKVLLICSFFLLASIILISCGSSAAISSKDKTDKKSSKKITAKNVKETFIITPYRTKINVKPNSNPDKSSHLNIWYGYNTNLPSETDTLNVIERVNGFRVQILSTDNLAQAKRMKNRVLQKVSQKHIYILFDPPFYKLQVGDFTVHSLAENLNFKLRQLGYSNSRIVREKVNFYR